MKNQYYKVANIAVASVCTVVSSVLGVTESVKAVTFTFAPVISFEVSDRDDGDNRFDGRGDVFSLGSFNIVLKGPFSETQSFAEFNVGNFFRDSNVTINRVVFQAEIQTFSVITRGVDPPINPGSLGIFGYVGNGAADLSDFGAGVLLSSVDVSSSSLGDLLDFDVTPFVKQRVNNGDPFVGFGIHALNLGGLGLVGDDTLRGIKPRLIVETSEIAEPVPEPTTIFGSITALGVAGLLKRKKLKPAKK